MWQMTVSKQCLVFKTSLSYKQAFPLGPLFQVKSFDTEMTALVSHTDSGVPKEVSTFI